MHTTHTRLDVGSAETTETDPPCLAAAQVAEPAALERATRPFRGGVDEYRCLVLRLGDKDSAVWNYVYVSLLYAMQMPRGLLW